MDVKLNMPFAEYLSQEGSEVPLFSKTVAKTILEKNPRIAHYYHPKLGGNKKETTPALIEGSIIHSVLLGHSGEIETLDYPDYRTNDAKAARDDAESRGMLPVLRKELDRYAELKSEVEKQIQESFPVFYNPDTRPEIEASIFYEYGNGVKCASRFDWISKKYGLIVDIKTTTDASPDKCERAIIDFGYDLQEAMYTEAAKQWQPGIDWRFIFIFVEKKPPYSVCVVETDDMSKEVGAMKAYIASETWRVCLEKDQWPSYGFQTVSVPPWEVKKYLEV